MSPPEVAPPPDVPAEEADALLRRYLAGRSTLCPNCRYDLRDLTGGQCPECGQDLVLRVGLAEPRLAAFITGLVAISAGVGFVSLLLLLMGFFALVDNSPGGPPTWVLLILFAELVIDGGLLWLWNSKRAWLQCQPAGRRGTYALCCFLVPVWSMLVFALMVISS